MLVFRFSASFLAQIIREIGYKRDSFLVGFFRKENFVKSK
jgi:hypothetical protein